MHDPLPRLTCLSDLEIVALMSGRLPKSRVTDAGVHIEACRECRELIAEVAREPTPSDDGKSLSKSESIRANRARYILDRELCSGGMGRIFVAFDRNLGTNVALKCIREGRADCRRFANEIRLMSSLQHPAIMPVQDAGWLDRDFPFFAMPLANGVRLDEVVARCTLEERLRLLSNVSTIVDAVAYAHSQGVLHLDIKPQNILIGRFGETILFDWGLGRRVSEPGPSAEQVGPGPVPPSAPAATLVRQLTTGCLAAGTPGYAAPEQLNGDNVDERADIYGLGTVLYHVLAGRPPRMSNDGKTPEPIHRVVPNLPCDLGESRRARGRRRP